MTRDVDPEDAGDPSFEGRAEPERSGGPGWGSGATGSNLARVRPVCAAVPTPLALSRESAVPSREGSDAPCSEARCKAPSGGITGKRRWIATLALAAGLIVLASGLALWRFTAALGPLDLTPAEDRSTVVLDRDGRLLRSFATADGRWRLPVTTPDVDPRTLAMLKAYEDARFDRHSGVDALALLRAGAQLVL